MLLALAAFFVVYHSYGRAIDRYLVEPDGKRPTPAHTLRDNVDYHPANPFFLFGHHFSSIAGAGPILGPVMAVFYFGWGAAFVWVILGAIFLGGIHDYLTLMISVRNKGVSIADIAAKTISPRAKLILSVFIWLALVLVVAVFALFAAETFISDPTIVIPSFGLIAIAMLVGWLVNNKGVSHFWGTVIGLCALAVVILVGLQFPVVLPFANAKMIWFVVLIVYCIVASVLPVWLLLQPRDYLSSYILLLGLIGGIAGVVIARPNLTAPVFVKAYSNVGPIWPMLCVIVACGAISGFHCIVSGGTTSKQLANEKHGKFIGYGAMLIEGILAVLALLAVASGLEWSRFSEIMSQKGGNPIAAFAEGYSAFFARLPASTKTFAFSFVLLMVNCFILTTLDTALRLGRFICAEIIPAKFNRIKQDRMLTTLITVLPVLYLGFSGDAYSIWPVFGAANQLIGALAFMVITAYFIGVRKPTRFTFFPMVFMLVTTIAALLYQSYKFFVVDKYIVLGSVSVVLLGLACLMVLDAHSIWREVILEGQKK